MVEAAEELAVHSARRPADDAACSACSTRPPTCAAGASCPNLYSHYGSRGIVLMTILQSWSQGVEVWGEPG